MLPVALLCWGPVSHAQAPAGKPSPAASPGAAPVNAGTAPKATPSAAPPTSSVTSATGTTTVTVEKPTPVPAQGPGSTADEAFNTRVKTLEEQVIDLKEKILRSKARLMMLQETVLGGDLGSGARAVLFHKNDMGPSFVLESVSYSLDGAPVFTKVDGTGDLDKRQEFEIFNGRIVPGPHQVSVRLEYRGDGFGVFSYLKGYKFRVQSSYTFTADAGKVTTVKVVGYEKGDLTYNLKDRPAVRYDIQSGKDSSAASAPQAGAL
jgi:hypothetical protein